MTKTLPFSVGGSIPGREAKIPHTSVSKTKTLKKKKQYCNRFNKDSKNGPHQKKKKSLEKENVMYA